MMARLRDPKDAILAKPEGDSIPQTASASSSLTIGTSRRWSGFKNPRIVRVSRTFGGKDRHSKVCTIRGLRDRRIRLSVPTAIQLYDLQERLGLSQPSKVIDWLLDATKLDIDELPPLHFPQFHDQHSLIGQFFNNFGPHSHHLAPYLDANLTLMNGHQGQIGSSGININDNLDGKDADGDEEGNNQHSLQEKLEKIKWNYNYNYNKASINNNNGEAQYQGGGNFFPSLMNSSSYGNLCHWDPSNLSLSTQFEGHGFLGPRSEESNQLNNGYPGEGSSSNSTQQLFFCPPSMPLPTTTASLFPQHDTSAAMSDGFHPSGSSWHVSNTNQQIDRGT